MKAFNCIAVLLIFFSVSTFVSHAQAGPTAEEAPTWEFTLGSGSILLGTSPGANSLVYSHNNSAGQGSHAWNFAVNGNYFLNNTLELGSTINIADYESTGLSLKVYQFLVGPTVNFLGTLENAFYLTGQAGVEIFSSGDFAPTMTTFSYFLGLGKRFEIVQHVTWKPEVALTGNTKATNTSKGFTQPANTGVLVIPFQFAVLF